ncbi:MAG: HEAT repeat domain-containing protein [Nitrospiraceae bacterium]|nr:MAG: HEAT repeat domain-containing protein [Nitrospiraceae bacterium]
MKKLIADYMENGFLENIIDMFKYDKKLFPLIGDMLEDERSRVRLGAVALVETLMPEHGGDIRTAIPGIAKALKNPGPTIRGDAAYLLGLIGHEEALPFLSDAIDDEHEMVKETVIEAIETIRSGAKAFSG